MRILVGLLAVAVFGAAALAQEQTPAQTFGLYRCTCESTGSAATGSPMGQLLGDSTADMPANWVGSAYATNDRDAAMKAQMACTSETKGGLFGCLNCICRR